MLAHPSATTELLNHFDIHVIMNKEGIMKGDLIMLDLEFIRFVLFLDIPFKEEQL